MVSRPGAARLGDDPGAPQLTEEVSPAAHRYGGTVASMESSVSNSIPPDADSALVDALVEYLNANVLDPDSKVTTIDMLDSLASIGGRLVPDTEGISSDEYLEELP
jgi:hypothetical protein